MNKRYIEYFIIAVTLILLIYACYSFSTYKYLSKDMAINDSISMDYPSSSEYTIEGDTIKFRNSQYDFYNMDVSKLNSSDERVQNLLYHFSSVNQGKIDYKNQSYYLMTVEYPDANGFKYHSMIIPLNSFNKDNKSFTNETAVYLFDGNNRDFVIDSAFLSQVVL